MLHVEGSFKGVVICHADHEDSYAPDANSFH